MCDLNSNAKHETPHPKHSSHDFAAWASDIRQLGDALRSLIAAGEIIGVAAPVGQEWFELLRHKLLPQVSATPWLVVAVVGGTNIGKSVVFNHLAGQAASGVSPMAAKTKHPVCLVPPGFADDTALARIFAGFALCPWHSEQDPWTDCDEHRLYWKIGAKVPPRLLVLDTPDIDSDAPVNWQRADIVRQTADVLVAVLTQQKYNDATVKQFFRHAAAANKPVIVVFNQCDLGDDRAYWPEWLHTFVSETGVDVPLVYVVPHDRAAAKELKLPFYAVGVDGRAEPTVGTALRDELATLHFDTIKIRTLSGALERVTDPVQGAPAYLAEVRQVSDGFALAARTLGEQQMARTHWPAFPSQPLVHEMHRWWDARRAAWSRTVHGAYRVLGEGVLWPFRKAYHYVAGEPVDPLVLFRQLERQAIIAAVEAMFDELTRLADVGNAILQPRLKPYVGGDARSRFLAQVTSAHEQLPALDEQFCRYIHERLDRFVHDHPGYHNWLSGFDHAAAVLRPVITFTFSFGVPIEHVIHQATAQAVTDSVTQAALSQVALHTGATVAIDAAATAGAGGGMKLLVGLFQDLQLGFCEQRRRWFERLIDDHLLGKLRQDLQRGAEVGRDGSWLQVQNILTQLRATPGLGQVTT